MGPHTTNEPTIGSKEQRAVTSPHRIGDGRPSTQNPKLIRIPCDAHGQAAVDVGNDRIADAGEQTLELIGPKGPPALHESLTLTRNRIVMNGGRV